MEMEMAGDVLVQTISFVAIAIIWFLSIELNQFADVDAVIYHAKQLRNNHSSYLLEFV